MNFQHEQLFTELTSVEAEIIEGGGGFSSTIEFDQLLTSRQFDVPNGHDVRLVTTNVTGDTGPIDHNRPYYAQLIRVDTTPDRYREGQNVELGSATTIWHNQEGGKYRIRFTDANDSRIIKGNVTVDTPTLA